MTDTDTDTDTTNMQPETEASQSRELRRLNDFIGTWTTEGPSYAEGTSDQNLTPSTVPMRSTETYAWLPGSAFLEHCWDGTVGDQPFQGLEMLGFDPDHGAYFSCFFDNNGNHPIYG